MKTDDLYRQRLTRILQAVALEEPDRVPVVLEYSGFAAYVTGTRMADFLGSPGKNLATMIEAWRRIGGADAINYGSFWPYGLCYDFMAKVAVPGVDLPADEMWQVVESELMIRADYDRLLEMGWPAFFNELMSQKNFARRSAGISAARKKITGRSESMARGRCAGVERR